MPRPRSAEINAAGQDSFLDVVTNIVGILVILVMLVGGRVQQLVGGGAAADSKAAELSRAIGELEATAVTLESEVDDLAAQTQVVAAAAAEAGQARLELATAVAAVKVDLEEARRTTDAATARAAEAAARRQQLDEELQRTQLEAEGLSHAAATTQEVLAYPTPIGRTVTGEEIHFRLAAGRIAYIPLTELFELAKAQTRRAGSSAASLATRIESVGPIQQFGLDYVIETRVDQARGQVLIRSREWVIRPVGETIGETAAEALAAGSRFRRVIAGMTPETTVTLWTYPDSFEVFREVRAELHRLGLPTAGRPLPEGAPIGGSAEGSKSVVH
ncbi:MAG: hypothetical protein EBR86_04090 [Planctomycetia bacterium]|nr:hypothetical protein [Planctomycetia bacterium]